MIDEVGGEEPSRTCRESVHPTCGAGARAATVIWSFDPRQETSVANA